MDAREESIDVKVERGLETKVHALEAEVVQLQDALMSRIVIEQAKGTLSVTHGVGVDEAFETLRSHARSQRRNIHEVAGEVVRNGGEFLALPSKSKTALADELHRLLMRAAEAAEELATLAPNEALLHLKAALADAFVWLSAAARDISPYWREEGEPTRYEGANGDGHGHNTEIDCGYRFVLRQPASNRVATVLVEAEAGAGAALTAELAQLALGPYLTDNTLPTRIVLGTDGSFQRA